MPPTAFRGGALVGGVPRGAGAAPIGRGSQLIPPPVGARGVMPVRGRGAAAGVGMHLQGLPPGAHLVKCPPPAAASATAATSAGLGRGAALSMSNSMSSVSPQRVSRGGVPVQANARGGSAPNAVMRGGKVPMPPGVQVKMPPGLMSGGKAMLMGKKMMMPPPGLSRPTSPSRSPQSTSLAGGVGTGAPSPGSMGRPSPSGSQRTPSPGAAPMPGHPPPLVSAGPHPPAPQFAVVNGKKIMVPPGTKLPGPAPPGLTIGGKKMMMTGAGGPSPTQQQQRPTTSPRPTFPSPGPGAKQPQHMPEGAHLLVPPGQQPPQSGTAGGGNNGGPSPLRPGTNPSPIRPQRGSSPPQQQQQAVPPVSFFSPAYPIQHPPPDQQQQQSVKKKHGVMNGLSGVLSFLKVDNDSDEEKVNERRHAQQQQQQQQPNGTLSPPPHLNGSPTPPRAGQPTPPRPGQPTPPRSAFIAGQGKKIILPPGAKLLPGMKGPPHLYPPSPSPPSAAQQRAKLPAGPVLVGPPPPGAMKMMFASAHPPPPQPPPQSRSGSVDSHENVPNLPIFLASAVPPRAVSPSAQQPRKVLLKAPPGAVVMKKVRMPPPAETPPITQNNNGGSSRLPSPEMPPLASLPSSRSASVLTPPDAVLSEQHQQQQQPYPPIAAGTHLVKHMVGPLPPGAKLITSPPNGLKPVASLQSHPPPHPLTSAPAPAGVLRVPSSTVLKDGELPEAGVQTPPQPRRRLGESSEDSDDEENEKASNSKNRRSNQHGNAQLAMNEKQSHAASQDSSLVSGEAPSKEDSARSGSAEHEQRQSYEVGVDAKHAEAETEEVEEGVDVAVEDDDNSHPSASPKSHMNNVASPPSSAETASASAQTSKKKKKLSAPLPPVRQTASSAAAAARSAAAAAAAKKKKREEAESALRRRQAKLAGVRRTPKSAKAEPASPQEEETTQKPPSIDRRSSASVVSTPSLSHSVASSSSGSSAASPHADASEHGVAQSDRRKPRPTPTRRREETQQQQQRRSDRKPTSPATQSKEKKSERKVGSSQKRRERRFNVSSDDDDDKSDDSGSERLTSRELYKLVHALRDKKAEKQRRGRRDASRGSSRCSGLDSANGDDNASEVEDWGLRSTAFSNSSGSRRRHSLSATRQRQRQKEEEVLRHQQGHHCRSSLPVSTIGIPWRYTSTSRTSEPFATPSPVRRPLGYINVGGGRYARVGGSPYALRRASTTTTGKAVTSSRHTSTAPFGRVHSVHSIPLDISNTTLHPSARNGSSPPLLVDALDPATSAIVDARDNAVVEEVRASSLRRRGGPVGGVRGSFSGASGHQQLRHSLPLNSPLRFSSPVRPEDGGLNESFSTVDSQHPYCVSASALLPSMQALTPARRSLNSPAPPSQRQQQQALLLPPELETQIPAQQQQQQQSSRTNQPPMSLRTAATATAREPFVELSPEKRKADPSPQPQQAKKEEEEKKIEKAAGGSRSSDTNNNNNVHRTDDFNITNTGTSANAAPSPLAALRRSAFFEQLHSGYSSAHTAAPITSSAAIVGGPSPDVSGSKNTLPVADANPLAFPCSSGDGGGRGSGNSAGWEWGRRRPTTPAESHVSNTSLDSAAYAPAAAAAAAKAKQRKHSPPPDTSSPPLVRSAAKSEVGGSVAPSLIPTTGSTAKNAEAAAMAAACPRNGDVSSVRASTPAAARHAQQQQQRSASTRVRASSVGAAVSAAATGQRSYQSHYNPDPYRPPSRKKEPVRLTRATIARLSTPQQRRGGGSAAAAAAMLSPIARRSAGGDANSSTAQTCSKWLDEILGSTTVTATGVRAGGKGQDAAAAAAGALPIVDLRSDFKPRVAEIEGSVAGSGPGKRAAALALQDPDANDYTRDFTGSRPRPHIPNVSFKHMVGARSQSPAHDTGSSSAAGAKHANGAAPPTITVREVHGVEDGLPFEMYSSIRIHDPTRKSPWALAPEREGLDVLPGRPALARRRRLPDPNNKTNAVGGDGSPHSEEDDGEEASGVNGTRKRKACGGADGRTVVEEVHLDEHRRPYLVVRPVPSAEAAEAQRIAVARLSKPKPIYQRAARI